MSLTRDIGMPLPATTSPKGSLASRGSRSSKSSHKPDLSDATIILNLSSYASKNGQLFIQGDRVVPLTLSGLSHARKRRHELRNVATKRLALFNSSESKEKKAIEGLFDCFRECPRLRVTQGAVSDDTVDLDDFMSLTSLELSGVRLQKVLNAPLGLKEVMLTQGSVLPMGELGEAVSALTLDGCKEVEMGGESLARFAENVVHLTVRGSIYPPKTLKSVLGGAAWRSLRYVKLLCNVLDMLPCLTQLPAVVNLNLSQNGIHQVRHLGDCSKLVTLDLSGNEIRSLEESAAHLPRSLISLNLAKNRLTTLRGLEGLPGLSKLNVSENQLSQWGEVYQLLQSAPISSLQVTGNAGLRKAVKQYRPLVAGMVDFDRWKVFLLDGKTLAGSEISHSQVRAVSAQYAEFFSAPDVTSPVVIGGEPDANVRSTRVVDLSPDIDGASFPSSDPELVSALIAGTVALLLVVFEMRDDDPSPAATPRTGRKEGKKKTYKVVKKLVPKKRPDETPRNDSNPPQATTPQHLPSSTPLRTADIADMPPPPSTTPVVIPPPTPPQEYVDSERESAYASHTQSQRTDPSDREVSDRETSATDGPSGSGVSEVKPAVQQPQRRLFADIAKSLSDSNGEELKAERAPLPDSLRLSDPQLASLTSISFRSVVEVAAEKLSRILSAGTIVPTLTRIAPGVKRGRTATASISAVYDWGDVVISTSPEAPPCFATSLYPPNVLTESDSTRLVAVDAITTDQYLTIRIRSGKARLMGRKANGVETEEMEWASDGGLLVHVIESFAGYGVESTASSTLTLANVQTWEVGEAKPWDVKKVTVAPTADAQYVTTFGGVTFLQRRQQADVRSSFHFASDVTLLAGFVVPDEQCQDLLVQLLKERLATCRRAPQWPVVNNLRQSSSTTVHKTFEQFQRDVGGVEPVSTEDLRAGSTLQEDMKTTNDLFVYFGSTLAGKRRPDYDLLQNYGIKKGIHILGDDSDLYDGMESVGEKLVTSCYCNVLLGNVSNEQEEKSCWIAISNTDTYFCLDLNYNPKEGRRARVPFPYLACHGNGDLAKVELGFSWQYMRLVYGGDNGMTYLLLPRSKSACIHLLSCLSTADGASVQGKITVHGSPFASRPLVEGQGELRGYFLAYMKQEQLIQRRKNRETVLCFPQDVYPLREMNAQMLPVSIIVTKDDILVATDRYASWPDGEVDANRWHLEKRAPLGDVVGLWAASAYDANVFPSRFEIEFESDSEERTRWKFAAQTPGSMRECTQLIKNEYENKWGSGTVKLNVETLHVAD